LAKIRCEYFAFSDIPVQKSFDNFNAETSSDSDEDEVSSKLFSEMDLNKCSSLHSCQETEG